jgi:energy-coupling factor transporter transmembrane protein EcfT
MFHLFPKGRQDWLRVLAFPFQAFVILAPIVFWYFMGRYSGCLDSNGSHPVYARFDYGHAMTGLADQILVGCLVCFFVLLAFGFYQRAIGHRVSARVDFVLAALSIILIFVIPNMIPAVATS